jgi:hypothetical protein
MGLVNRASVRWRGLEDRPEQGVGWRGLEDRPEKEGERLEQGGGLGRFL